MKKIHLNTTVSFMLSGVSLALTFYQYKFTPGFDYRIVAGVLALLAWLATGSEFVKYTSWYQIAGFFLSGIVLGLSIDKFMHTVPFITISLLLANFSLLYRTIFRRYFAEPEYRWLDPLIFLTGLVFYVAGNIGNDYGWMGWSLPLLIFGFIVFMQFQEFKFSAIQSAFAKKKMGIDSGKTAPSFSLPDHDGNMVNLSDFTGKRNILLIFVRGDWCPSCHMKLRTYQKHSDKFQAKNVMLFAIGPDPVGVNREMASKLGIEYKVLSDEGQKTAIAYSVQLPTAVVGEKYNPGIPLPATFLIDKNGIVRYCSRPDKIGEFLDPASILPVLESLN